MSRDEMERVLSRTFQRDLAPDENVRLTHTFWYSVDSFLMATGNISKTFWPTKPPMPPKEERHDGWEEDWEKGWERNKLRGEELRKILAIDDESPFRKDNRTLRDHFEHFDERLDKWFFQFGGRSLLIDSSIAPHYAIELIQYIFAPSHVFRTFDPNSWVLYCLGDTLDFKKMVVEVERLQASLHAHPPESSTESSQREETH
jgi:hypothetical protein